MTRQLRRLLAISLVSSLSFLAGACSTPSAADVEKSLVERAHRLAREGRPHESARIMHRALTVRYAGGPALGRHARDLRIALRLAKWTADLGLAHASRVELQRARALLRWQDASPPPYCGRAMDALARRLGASDDASPSSPRPRARSAEHDPRS